MAVVVVVEEEYDNWLDTTTKIIITTAINVAVEECIVSE